MARGAILTDFEQGEAWALYKFAHWPYQRIADALNTTKGAIQSAVYRHERNPRTPRRRGPPPVINTSKRQRLIRRATTDAFSRRLRFDQVAALEGIFHDIRTIRNAFAKEGFSRYVATRKPFLTTAHKEARLRWAIAHRDWSDRQWMQVLWTDEASFRCGLFGQVYVTRQANEAFNDDCLIARFRKYSACMVWACISAEGPGELFVFEKGSVDGECYRQNVVPLIDQVVIKQRQSMTIPQDVVVMQDNASIHRAKATIDLFKEKGLILIEWPANSPDLNPIENIWYLLKHRVSKHSPRTREEVMAAIRLEWSRLTASDIQRVCQSMRRRCEAVIAANGGHTKW